MDSEDTNRSPVDAWRNWSVTDLSVILAEELPCSWPGHMPFQHKIYNWFADNEQGPQRVSGRLGPYQTCWFTIDEHTGTHVDAPIHGVPPADSGLPGAGPGGAISAAELPLEQVVGPAVVLDVSGLVGSAEPGVSPKVGISVIEAFESEHGRIEAGDIPLLRGDWDRHYLSGEAGTSYVSKPLAGEADAWPAFDIEAIELLLERGVRCIGTDAPSIGAAENGGPIHDVGFAGGMIFVEGLAGLRELPARGALFMALPLKLRGGTGTPVRAVAIEMKGGGH